MSVGSGTAGGPAGDERVVAQVVSRRRGPIEQQGRLKVVSVMVK